MEKWAAGIKLDIKSYEYAALMYDNIKKLYEKNNFMYLFQKDLAEELKLHNNIKPRFNYLGFIYSDL